MTFRVHVYKHGGWWHCSVVEPNDDGDYVKLTDLRMFSTWQEAIRYASWWRAA